MITEGIPGFPLGDGYIKCFPWIIAGTISAGKGNESHVFYVRGRKKKHHSTRIADFDMGTNQSFAAIDGKKVRITIEVLDE